MCAMDNDLKKAFDEKLDEISFRSYAVCLEGKLLASGLNLKELVDIATDMFVELMRVESGYLMLFDEKSRELNVKSVKGLKQKRIEKEISLKTENEVVKWITDWRKLILPFDIDELFVREFFGKISEKTGSEVIY